MKNRLFSILLALFITPLFLSCGLPPNSFEDPMHDPQQGNIYDGTKVSTEKIKINDIKYSPDGAKFAVATSIGILLYDTQTYGKPNLLKGHSGRAWSVAFSPDGKTLASAAPYNTIRLLDRNTGQLIRILKGQKGTGFTSVEFSPDGKTIAGETSEDTLCLIDVDTGKRLHTFSGHSRQTGWNIAFSPDRRIIAAGGQNGIIRLWDVHTGQLLRTLNERKSKENMNELNRTVVAFSPDGKTLASEGHDTPISLWDVNTGEKLRNLIGPVDSSRFHSMAFSPDGRMIVSGSMFATILWDANTGQQLQILTKPVKPFGRIGIHLATFSPDGKTIATCGCEQVHLWDVNTGQHLRTLISRF